MLESAVKRVPRDASTKRFSVAAVPAMASIFTRSGSCLETAGLGGKQGAEWDV
jgi:hypothetical protein